MGLQRLRPRRRESLSTRRLRAKGMTAIGNSIHAVTVPGALEAWEAILAAHGRFGLERALQPAIRYAEGGFPVAARVAWDWQRYVGKLAADAGRGETLSVQWHGAGGRRRDPFSRAGRNVESQSPPRARAPFIEGEIADDMVATLAARGSFLNAEDFARHRGEAVKPIATRYRGHRSR